MSHVEISVGYSLVCDHCLIPATLIVVLLNVFLLKKVSTLIARNTFHSIEHEHALLSQSLVDFQYKYFILNPFQDWNLDSLGWEDLVALAVNFVRLPGTDVPQII